MWIHVELDVLVVVHVQGVTKVSCRRLLRLQGVTKVTLVVDNEEAIVWKQSPLITCSDRRITAQFVISAMLVKGIFVIFHHRSGHTFVHVLPNHCLQGRD